MRLITSAFQKIAQAFAGVAAKPGASAKGLVVYPRGRDGAYLFDAERAVEDTPGNRLLEAIYLGNLPDFLRALDDGADPNSAERSQPLHEAASCGRLDFIDCLLKAGADVDARADYTEEGFDLLKTPCGPIAALHVAAIEGHAEACRILVAAGADPNAVDDFGWKPLHHAAHDGRKEACEALLALGAKVDAKAKSGQTPWDRAARRGHVDICEALALAGARPSTPPTKWIYESTTACDRPARPDRSWARFGYSSFEIPSREDQSLAAQILLALLNEENRSFQGEDPLTLDARVMERLCGIRAHLSIEEHRYGCGVMAYLTEPTHGMGSGELESQEMDYDWSAIGTLSGYTSGGGISPTQFAFYCGAERASPHAMIVIERGHPINAIKALFARYQNAPDGIRVFTNELTFAMGRVSREYCDDWNKEVEALIRNPKKKSLKAAVDRAIERRELALSVEEAQKASGAAAPRSAPPRRL